MSMAMNAPITAPPAKPTAFSAAPPSSTIRITGQGFPVPVEAVVLRSEEEVGPRRVPGLFVRLDDGTERLVLQEGVQIEVLKNPSTLFEGFVPKAAVAATRRPTDIIAVQFRGDVENAVEILQWCAGKASVHHLPAEGDLPARLVFSLGGGITAEAIPGSWVYLEHDEIKVMGPEDFQVEFEVRRG